MDDMTFATFGEYLRAFRKQRKLTQQQLAARIGVHRNTVGSWEVGTFLPESKTIVLELAHQLQLKAEDTRRLLEASLIALSPYWSVPYLRNPFFTGRDEVLEQMHIALSHEYTLTLCQSYAVTGLGGIGKTQTVLEYAYRYAHHYSAVFWINAETPETQVNSMLAIVELLHLPAFQEQDQRRIVLAVTHWLNCHSQWLLIVDNVEKVEQTKEILPSARDGALLFTSRRQAFGLAAQSLLLGPMTREESVRFLLHRARRRAPMMSLDRYSEQENVLAWQIVEAIDGLPLALDQAGAYIEATQCSLDEYVHHFEASPICLLAEREPYADHPASVVKTFTMALTHLQTDNAFATEVLIVCAFLAPEAIPEEFFVQGAEQLGSAIAPYSTDRFHFQTALKALLTYSLVQRHDATHTLTMHRLVQAVMRDTLTEEARHRWAERIIATMAAIFPRSDTKQKNYMQAGKRLLSHALQCLHWGEHWQTEVTPRIALMHHVAFYYTNLAQFAQAEQLHHHALQMSELVLDPLHPLMTVAYSNLGRLYQEQGRYAEAETLVLRALGIREKLLGPDHPEVAITKTNLAVLFMEQGKYAEAEPLMLTALSVYEQVFDAQHPSIGSAINNLAVIYQEQAQFDKAEPLFHRALQIWQHALGVEHHKVAVPLNNLAEIYLQQGRYAEAESLLLQALHLTEQGLGDDHLKVAYPLINLGDLYHATGRLAEAESMYQRALSIKQQTFSASHQQIMLVQQKLVALGMAHM